MFSIIWFTNFYLYTPFCASFINKLCVNQQLIGKKSSKQKKRKEKKNRLLESNEYKEIQFQNPNRQ